MGNGLPAASSDERRATSSEMSSPVGILTADDAWKDILVVLHDIQVGNLHLIQPLPHFSLRTGRKRRNSRR